ncbi:class F sortase [Nocardioides panacis]|uniref:Class F sortase n=1 Tax=Nocardioides panacis TaxID=2849501 RepID=A0A975SW18_9ACTN|nr:class F sortase [Nocardioides panacis]QWZ06871.1 class F sortase [Nocardioides panacis]
MARPGPGKHRAPRGPVTLVTVVLFVGVLLASWAVGRSDGDTRATRDTGSADRPSTAEAPVPVTAARRARSVVVPEAPSAARLPSGRVVPVRAVSTSADGSLDLPEDVGTAGWWRGGSRVGDPFGSMLLAAHIDSTTQGLGPYAELLRARPGQRVRITTRHLTQVFVVRSLRLVAQGPLDRHPWISAPTGPPRLTLVTCAPPYDPSRGGYQRVAVLVARPLAPPARRTG